MSEAQGDTPLTTEASIVFTAAYADLAAAYRLYGRGRSRSYILPFICLMVILTLLASLTNLPAMVFILAGIGGVTGGLIGWIWQGRALSRAVQRTWEQSAELRREHVMSWSEDGLVNFSTNAKSTILWQDFIGIRESDHTILLYHTDHMFTFIPKRLLSAAQVLSLKNACRQVPEKR